MSLRDDLLAVRPKTQVVRYESLCAYVREMSAGERMELHQLVSAEENGVDFPSSVALFTACDESGNRLFESLDEVQRLPNPLVVTLFEAGVRLNRIAQDDLEEQKKSSEATVSDVPSSD